MTLQLRGFRGGFSRQFAKLIPNKALPRRSEGDEEDELEDDAQEGKDDDRLERRLIRGLLESYIPDQGRPSVHRRDLGTQEGDDAQEAEDDAELQRRFLRQALEDGVSLGHPYGRPKNAHHRRAGVEADMPKGDDTEEADKEAELQRRFLRKLLDRYPLQPGHSLLSSRRDGDVDLLGWREDGDF
jgi:hypothetical protein